MALVTLTYNSFTGSDAAASGAGPSVAVTGTAAAHTGGVASTTIEFSNTPDLSGVSANDVLLLVTSSGSRHLTRIISVNDGADTVVVEDSFNIAAGSSVNYAIGGKRRTFTSDTSRQDVKDASAGWRFEAEGSFTYFWAGAGALVPAVGNTTDGGIEIVAAANASPTFSWTGDGPLLATIGGTLALRDIAFSNTTSTNPAARVLRAISGITSLEMVNCSAICSGTCVYAFSGALAGRIVSCDLESTHENGIEIGKDGALLVLDCEIHECGVVGASAGVGQGIFLSSSVPLSSVTLRGNRIWGQYDNGIQIDSDSTEAAAEILNNVIDDNGGHGIYFAGTLDISNRATILNNSITENGGYGIKVNSASGGDTTVWNDFNAFRGNVSGEVSNLTMGEHSLILTADPYVDSANHDFRKNDVSGGGAALKGSGLGFKD